MAHFNWICLTFILISGNLMAQKTTPKKGKFSELHPANYAGSFTPQKLFSGTFRGDAEFLPKGSKMGLGLGIEGIQGVNINVNQDNQVRGFGLETQARVYSDNLEFKNYAVSRSFFSFGYYYQHLKQNANFIRLEPFEENGITLFREVMEADLAKLNRFGLTIMGGFQRINSNKFLFEGYFGTTYMISRIKDENSLAANNRDLFSRSLYFNYDYSGFLPRVGFKFGILF